MYTVEVSDGKLTASRRCRTAEKAREIASEAMRIGRIYLGNPEMSPEQNYMAVASVRVYDKDGNDI